MAISATSKLGASSSLIKQRTADKMLEFWKENSIRILSLHILRKEEKYPKKP